MTVSTSDLPASEIQMLEQRFNPIAVKHRWGKYIPEDQHAAFLEDLRGYSIMVQHAFRKNQKAGHFMSNGDGTLFFMVGSLIPTAVFLNLLPGDHDSPLYKACMLILKGRITNPMYPMSVRIRLLDWWNDHHRLAVEPSTEADVQAFASF